jgi:hypothetical protein
MKLDKETIVKHQFWFLLGTYLVVWLIAVLWLKFAAADPIAEAKKTYKNSSDKLSANSKDPKNPNTFCPPWEEYAKVFDGHKQVIWGKAWDYQKPMFTWPFESKINSLQRELIPQDELSPEELEQFKRTLYNGEMEDLEKASVGGRKDRNPQGFLTPVELEGGFDAIMKPQKWTETPTREECWLAQEDFWVRRELLYDLAYAVAAQAYMPQVPIDAKKEPPPADAVSRLRFRNQNWEITLLIKEDKDKKALVVSRDSTIKNVHPGGRTQPLASAKGEGIVFNVYQDKAYSRFELKGEPVPWEQTVPFGSDYVLGDIQWKDEKIPVQMSQAFDWYTCPIRRVEALEIGQQSCRTFTTTLKTNDTLAKLDAPREAPADPNATKTDATGAGAAGASGGAGMMGGTNPMMMGMMGGAPTGTPANITPNNNIERNRYLQAPKEGDAPEKPSRHLPLAIALIVDQSNMHDVLVALANSRLRIQITQVEFHRARGIKPLSDDEKKSSGSEILRSGPVMPTMGGMYGGMPRMRGPSLGMGGPTGGGKMIQPGGGGMMGQGQMQQQQQQQSSRMMMMMMGRGSGGGSAPKIVGPTGMMGMPGMTPGGSSSNATKAAQAQEDENLVEMTVYCIATLYRRLDPPKTDGQPTPPAPAPR